EPVPQAAGTVQTMTVTGLSASTTYYFAMMTDDEVPNRSSMSNVVSGVTADLPDTTAPAAVTNLSVTGTTSSSVSLRWSAPGDDGSTGTAAEYVIRYSTSPITVSNWDNAKGIAGEPVPQAAGTVQTMTVTGLSASTTYYFAMMTDDEVPNRSSMSNVVSAGTAALADTTPPYTAGHSPSKGATEVLPGVILVVHVKDDESGVDINSIIMKVNGIVVKPTITGTPADYTLTYDPSMEFDYGQTVTVTIEASDLAHN
ncbi:MAG: fibronectin type III domain-containing protein, partial [Candidatus Omnitrophica bacterium]|nr:fibronectin type III domain-containing protein [Candidatus Omnitrophota bacterium]